MNVRFWLDPPFFSEKSILLIEKGKTISEQDEVANTLNDFFSNIVETFNIPEQHTNALHHRLSNHPTLKAILKYKNHPSINTIRCATKYLSSFYFSKSTKTLIKEKLGNKQGGTRFRHSRKNFEGKCWVFLLNKYAANLMKQCVLQSFQLLSN